MFRKLSSGFTKRPSQCTVEPVEDRPHNRDGQSGKKSQGPATEAHFSKKSLAPADEAHFSKKSLAPVAEAHFSKKSLGPTAEASRSKKTLFPAIAATSVKKSLIPQLRSRATSADREVQKRSAVSGSSVRTKMRRRSQSLDDGRQLFATPSSVSAHRTPSHGSRIGCHIISSTHRVPRKDTRPLTDKQFQASALAKVRKYFQTHYTASDYYQPDVSSRNMTIKMFVELMGFLLRQLFPRLENITVSNYKELIPLAMKKANYPGSVNRSWLVTANTPHSWPHVLAVLSWLVSVVDLDDTNVSQETGDNIVDSATCVEVVQCIREQYTQYQHEGVVVKDHINAIIKGIVNKHSIKEEDMQNLKDEIQRMNKILNDPEELARIKELEKLEEQLKQMNAEVEKLNQQIPAEHVQTRMEEELVASKALERKQLDVELRQRKQKVKELTKAVNSQPVSVANQEKILAESATLRSIISSRKSHSADIDKDLFNIAISVKRLGQPLRDLVMKDNTALMEQSNKLVCIKDLHLTVNVNNLDKSTLDELSKEIALVDSRLTERNAEACNLLWQWDDKLTTEGEKNQKVMDLVQHHQEEVTKTVSQMDRREAESKSKRAEMKEKIASSKMEIERLERMLRDLLQNKNDSMPQEAELNELMKKRAESLEKLEHIKHESKIILEGMVRIFNQKREELKEMENEVLKEIENEYMDDLQED